MGRVVGEVAYLFKWTPGEILWHMNLEQLIFWREMGWKAHWAAQGYNVDAPAEESGPEDETQPDRAGIRRRWGSNTSR